MSTITPLSRPLNNTSTTLTPALLTKTESKVAAVSSRSFFSQSASYVKSFRQYVIKIISGGYAFLVQIANKIKDIWSKLFFSPIKHIKHRDLLNIAKALGYETSAKKNDGMCMGIAFMGIQAALIGESSSFNGRLERLTLLFNKHKGNVVAVAKAINDDHVLLIDFLPFFDGVHLRQKPECYPDVFTPKTIPNKDSLDDMVPEHPKSIEAILALTISQKLEAKGGICEITRSSGVYDSTELVSYLTQLKEIFDKSDTSVAIDFGSINHAISIVYDVEKKSWFFIDANQLPIKEVKKVTHLAKFIQRGYKAKTCVLFNKMYALKKDAASLKKQLKIGLNSKEFKKIHEVTPEKAKLVNLSNNSSWLLIAIMAGEETVVQALIDNGADLNINSLVGSTPLFLASKYGHFKIVKALLAHGASVDAASSDGMTPLQVASSQGQLKIVEALLAHGASVDAASSDGMTPLHAASSQGQLKIVEALLAHGASVDAASSDGVTSLMATSLEGHLKIVEALLAHGASVDAASSDGITSLMAASLRGHLKIVEALLAHGANLNATCFEMTPFRIAIEAGHLEIVKTLLAHGAKAISTDIDIARNGGHLEIVQILTKYMKAK